MALIDINLNPPKKALRNFGIAGVVVFGALALLIKFTGGLPFLKFPDAAPTVALCLAIVAGFCGLASLLMPAANRPLYIVLTILSFPVGLVVSFVILAVMFYGMFLPLSLIFRLIGRDLMHRRFEPKKASYWHDYQAPASVQRYFKQF